MRAGVLILLLTSGCGIENDLEGQPAEEPEASPPNPVQVDELAQLGRAMVDVLFVVDNSGSMGEEQEALGASFPAFMSYFLTSGLDYHIGVVSTDMRDPTHSGRLQGWAGDAWIDATTPNPEEVFPLMASLGTRGSGDERGLDAARAAVEHAKVGANMGFVRDEAPLHMILISDEDDGSVISPDDFSAWANGLRAEPGHVTFSSIVNVDWCCMGGSPAEEPGEAYMEVSEATGGVVYDIRSESWDAVLDELGLLASQLIREFFLTERPIPDTIEVWIAFGGSNQPVDQEDWSYDPARNSVVMTDSFRPPPGSEVFIRYEVDRTTSKAEPAR